MTTQVLPQDYPAQRYLNKTTQLPPEVKDFFSGYIGVTAKKRAVLHYLAEQTTLPAKSGTSIVIPTFKRMEVGVIQDLGEGITPIGAQIKREDIKLTPKQYGHYVEVSDRVVMTVQDNTLQHTAYTLGMHLSELCDKIIAAELNTTANVAYANGGVQNGTAQNPGYIIDKDIMRCCSDLKQNSAYMVSPNLFGSTVFGSTPVREAFYSFVNVKVENDLYEIAGFQSLAKYGSSEAAHWLPGEIGEFMNARFISSLNLPEDTVNNGATNDKPHLSNFFVGRYAYYVTKFGLGSTEFIMTVGSGFDPLKQRIQIGYKTWYGAKINTTNKWIIKLVSRTSTTV